MKQYILLRDNRQFGPHPIEQLGSIGLLPLDLIWVKDESTSWKYPEEIEELKDLITPNAPQKTNRFSNTNEKIFISLPNGFSNKNQPERTDKTSSLTINEPEPVLETNYTQSLDELKENYQEFRRRQHIWKRKMFASKNAASVASIFIGVVLGAFIVKKWVDGYEPTTLETANAIPVIDRDVPKQPDQNMQNALVTEIVPVYKNTPVKISKKANVKKQLRVTTNDYKVGLFGGINGLQLTVFNTSPQVVDKVIVALDYLRPNGTIVQSENIAFSSIKPKGAQTIAIPGSNRGVKVKYKILKVYAHDYKPDLKQI